MSIEAASTVRRPWYQRYRVPMWMGGALGVMALYLLLTGFEAEVYRIKWRGEPTTLEECREYLNLPPDDGSGELWKKAFDAAKEARGVACQRPTYLDRGYDRLPFVGLGSAPNDSSQWYTDLPIAVEFLKHFEKATELADEAIATGHGIAFCTDYSRYTYGYRPDELVGVRELHRVASLKAIVCIAEHRFDDAILAVEAQGDIGKSLDSAPSSIFFMLRSYVLPKEFEKLLAYMLASNEITSSDWIRIRSSRQPFSSQELQIASMICSRSFGIEYELNESLVTDPARYSRFRFRKLELLHSTRMIELARLDWHQMFRPSAELISRQVEISPQNRTFLLSAMLAEARQRLHLTAIASKIFSIENGRLPDSIDQLVPEHLDQVPLFPATDDPMIMRENYQGELLFSYPVLPPHDLPDLEIPTFRYRVKPAEWTD